MSGRVLPEGWQEVTIGEVARVSSGGTPTRSRADYYSPPEVPWVKTGDLRDGDVLDYDEFISNLGLQNSAAQVFPRGTVLVAMYGATVGRLGRLVEPAACNQAAAGLVSYDGVSDSKWLFYQLLHSRDDLAGFANGAAQQNLNAGHIRSFRIAVPPLPVQRAIAEVLGALDDKIAANLRLVKVADQLAAATVEQHLLRSSRVALRDVATITFGTSPSGTSLNEAGEGVAFYQGVRDFGFRSPSLRVSTTAPVRLANAGDVLVSVRAPVGSINVAPSTLCIGRGLAAVRSKEAAQSVLFHVLRSPGLWGVFESGGTVFGSISSKELSALAILWPSDPEIAERSVAPIEAQIVASVEQNRLLAATRDALLPALMSGRLTVRDAERVVADVT